MLSPGVDPGAPFQVVPAGAWSESDAGYSTGDWYWPIDPVGAAGKGPPVDGRGASPPSGPPPPPGGSIRPPPQPPLSGVTPSSHSGPPGRSLLVVLLFVGGKYEVGSPTRIPLPTELPADPGPALGSPPVQPAPRHAFPPVPWLSPVLAGGGGALGTPTFPSPDPDTLGGTDESEPESDELTPGSEKDVPGSAPPVPRPGSGLPALASPDPSPPVGSGPGSVVPGSAPQPQSTICPVGSVYLSGLF